MEKDIIYLIGMPGVGKTSLAKKISEDYNFEFYDLDYEIEKTYGEKVNNIFKKEGEDGFREKESKTLEKLSGIKGAIIATGGGIILRPKNIRLMKKRGKIIYLKAELDTLCRNINNDNKNIRPLLVGESLRKRLEKLYRNRKDIYEGSADIIVFIHINDTIDDIVHNIIEKINNLL